MHCHVTLHNEIGMSIALQVNDEQGQLPEAPPNFPRCGDWKQDMGKGSSRWNTESSREGGNHGQVTEATDIDDSDRKRGAKSRGFSFEQNPWLAPVLGSLFAVCVVAVVASAFYKHRQNRAKGQQYRELRAYGNRVLRHGQEREQRNLSNVVHVELSSGDETANLL